MDIRTESFRFFHNSRRFFEFFPFSVGQFSIWRESPMAVWHMFLRTSSSWWLVAARGLDNTPTSRSNTRCWSSKFECIASRVCPSVRKWVDLSRFPVNDLHILHSRVVIVVLSGLVGYVWTSERSLFAFCSSRGDVSTMFWQIRFSENYVKLNSKYFFCKFRLFFQILYAPNNIRHF